MAELVRRPEHEIRAIELYATAVHEAGHAVARLVLARMNYIGQPMPATQFVAVSLNGEALPGPDGALHNDCTGVVVGGLCCFWLWGSGEPPPGLSRAEMRRRAMADVVVTMAGPIAEMIEEGCPYDDADEWVRLEGHRAYRAETGRMAVGDMVTAAHRTRVLGRRWRLHFDRAFALADQIVREHQPHIHALAKALVERGQIEGDEVEAIFEAAAAAPGVAP